MGIRFPFYPYFKYARPVDFNLLTEFRPTSQYVFSLRSSGHVKKDCFRVKSFLLSFYRVITLWPLLAQRRVRLTRIERRIWSVSYPILKTPMAKKRSRSLAINWDSPWGSRG